MPILTNTPPGGDAALSALPARPLWRSIGRGMLGRCPHCGKGRIFRAYLKTAGECPNCREALHHHQADDAPPYFTVFAAGHIVVPVMLAVETAYAPPIWAHMAMFLPLTTILCLALLPIAKGGVVGLQWANYMHGFDPNHRNQEAALEKAP